MDNKICCRLYAKELRKTLNLPDLSREFVKSIRELDCYKSAKNVMLYYPMEYEINLLELLNDDKNFYLPKVSANNLLTCPYSKNLEKSKLNIMEPCTNPVNPEIIDLIIVPALMCDKEGYRLGYGGGYYDRFLPECTNAFKLAVIPEELFAETLPHEKFDIKMDYIYVKRTRV